MSGRYESAGAFRQALEARLARSASARGLPLNTLRQMVVMERLLARLFLEPHGPWLLKGGYAMELRLRPRARTTRDLDLSTHLAPDLAGDARHDAVLDALRMNTETGTMRVSTPEATVFDLLRHVEACGHLDNVATVIAELADVIAPRAFVRAAAVAHVTEIQRAGYLLELVGREELARSLESVLQRRRVSMARLRPGAESKGVPTSRRWKLALNEHVEPDL
jgi:hypothetical protein